MAETPGESPKCCPNCSADLLPADVDGACWHCRRPLPSEILGLVPPKLQSPRLSILSPRDRRLARYLKLLFAVFFIGVLSITKGFIALVAVPLLLVVIPAVAWAQITTDLRLAKGSAHPSMPRLADIQLASACVLYFVMPMAGDGSPTIIYIVSAPAAESLFPFLTVASAIGFLIASAKFFQASRAAAAAQ